MCVECLSQFPKTEAMVPISHSTLHQNKKVCWKILVLQCMNSYSSRAFSWICLQIFIKYTMPADVLLAAGISFAKMTSGYALVCKIASEQVCVLCADSNKQTPKTPLCIKEREGVCWLVHTVSGTTEIMKCNWEGWFNGDLLCFYNVTMSDVKCCQHYKWLTSARHILWRRYFLFFLLRNERGHFFSFKFCFWRWHFMLFIKWQMCWIFIAPLSKVLSNLHSLQDRWSHHQEQLRFSALTCATGGAGDRINIPVSNGRPTLQYLLSHSCLIRKYSRVLFASRRHQCSALIICFYAGFLQESTSYKSNASRSSLMTH